MPSLCSAAALRPVALLTLGFSALPTATCEMCGMVGVRDAFYSKTKRFCSVSCSRSYSSNSKKASILARLQVAVQTQFLYLLLVCVCQPCVMPAGNV